MDDFLFGGYESGALSILQHELIENWGLNDANSITMQQVCAILGICDPLIHIPAVIQNGTDGVFRFAPLKYKNGTTHNE